MQTTPHTRPVDARWDSPAIYPYVVRYYDPKASKRGQGVQARIFATLADAEAFAAGKRLYSRPAVAELREVAP